MSNETHRRIAWVGMTLGLLLLILQAFITIPLRMTEGGGFFFALVFYFSFFTILTNTGLVRVYAAGLSGWRRLRFLAGPTARTMMAGAILVVMLVYALLLAPLWNPQGLERLLDVGLHYVAPALYLIWWVVGPHPVRLRYGRVLVMMIYPLGYCVWVIARGITIERWPYPFVSVPELGWGQVLMNMAGLALVFVAVYFAAVAIARRLHARARFGHLMR